MIVPLIHQILVRLYWVEECLPSPTQNLVQLESKNMNLFGNRDLHMSSVKMRSY